MLAALVAAIATVADHQKLTSLMNSLSREFATVADHQKLTGLMNSLSREFDYLGWHLSIGDSKCSS